jgi:hypothetical protein
VLSAAPTTVAQEHSIAAHTDTVHRRINKERRVEEWQSVKLDIEQAAKQRERIWKQMDDIFNETEHPEHLTYDTLKAMVTARNTRVNKSEEEQVIKWSDLYTEKPDPDKIPQNLNYFPGFDNLLSKGPDLAYLEMSYSEPCTGMESSSAVLHTNSY